MGIKDYFRPHSSNVLCDQCGKKFKSEELQKQWNNLMVCSRCYEPRNIQDFIKGVPDNKPRPYYRPEPEDTFLP